jgi:hypothetical protein
MTLAMVSRTEAKQYVPSEQAIAGLIAQIDCFIASSRAACERLGIIEQKRYAAGVCSPTWFALSPAREQAIRDGERITASLRTCWNSADKHGVNVYGLSKFLLLELPPLALESGIA